MTILSSRLNVFIFRHGQTDWNAERRIQGHIDIELNANGRAEAKNLRSKLEELELEKIYSSDLLRAKETAQIVAGHLEIETTPRLREAHFGEAEGKIFTDALSEYGEMYFRTEPKYWNLRFPGGESKKECMDRVWKFINEVAEKKEYRSIGISSHGGVIRNIVHSLIPEDNPKIEIENCCLYHLELTQYGWNIVGLL